MKRIYKLLMALGLLNLLLLAWATLPLPQIVPTHLNAQNTIDGMGSKWLLLLTGLIGVALPAFVGGYKSYTKSKNDPSRNTQAEELIFVVCSVLLIGISWFTYGISASGGQLGETLALPFDLIIGIPVGVSFVILGNFMGLIKQNFYLGIRTPWTLMDGEVWKKTHRLGGYTMMLSGILMIALTLAGHRMHSSMLLTWGVGGAVLLGALVPCAYSFLLYTKIQRGKNQ